MDVGSEVFWMPMDTQEGQIRTTHHRRRRAVPAVGLAGVLPQGRRRHGVRPQLGGRDRPDSINSKAFSVVIGGGWAFRPDRRFGFQVFALSMSAALGDLQYGRRGCSGRRGQLLVARRRDRDSLIHAPQCGAVAWRSATLAPPGRSAPLRSPGACTVRRGCRHASARAWRHRPCSGRPSCSRVRAPSAMRR